MRKVNFKEELKKRILVLDGAMGTVIQKYNLKEEDYNGKKGCNEILNITKKDIVREIHRKYIEAGADIIETNTFNCNEISLEEYGLGDKVYELNFLGAKLAKEEAQKIEKRKIYVAGSIGPTSKTLTVPTGKNPYDRGLEFDQLKKAYKEQIKGLIDGGVDLLLIETIFDGLNAKCAVISAEEVMEEKGIKLPVMISATVNKEGRIFTGQSIESLIVAIDREFIVSYGFNCSFGAKELIPLVKRLEKFTLKPISLYPNAGLPNENGEYLETPEITANYLKELVDERKVNILGGCCGTTFEHIKEIANLVRGRAPREFNLDFKLKNLFSGNDIYDFTDSFTKIGERNNVAGSRIFKNLIAEGNYIKALEIASNQIENGAKIIDVNMDDGLLESEVEMERFLRVIQNDRAVSKVPIMIDSSDFKVIERGLKNIAGKGIVNSISLKEGEEEFVKKAKIIKKYGFAVVVMAFDERGQGVSSERKIEICKRSYEILKKLGYEDSDILFDLNILAIGTGMEADRYNGREFLIACEWIKKNFKDVGVVGGLSNLSFAFRGNNLLRAGIHQIFIELAKEKGLNFAILNPKEKMPDLHLEEKNLIKELIFGEEESLDKIFKMKILEKKEEKITKILTLEERIENALIKGGSSEFEKDIEEALKKYKPLEIIQNILMVAMQKLGEDFEKGEVYLPQLIRSSEVMNKAVEIITPYLEKEEKCESRGRVVMATVEGDVHDIGKNIVGTVLKCNGYEIIDVGVMASKEKIYSAVMENKADVVTLSGLISPSLKEMEKVLTYFREQGEEIPILIAGATTSSLHTALKLEPLYPEKTIHVTEAIDTLQSVNSICSEEKEIFLKRKNRELKDIKELYEKNRIEKLEEQEEDYSYETIAPKKIGEEYLEIELEKVERYINLDILLHTLKVKGSKEEQKVLEDIDFLLKKLKEEDRKLKAVYGVFPCRKIAGKLELEGRVIAKEEDYICKFLNAEDYLGAFAITFKSDLQLKEEYYKILEQLLATRIVEAGGEYLERFVSEENWKVKIRPAIGYPTLPEHSLKKEILKLLKGERTGIELTNNYAMLPLSSICGLYLANPKSRYKN